MGSEHGGFRGGARGATRGTKATRMECVGWDDDANKANAKWPFRPSDTVKKSLGCLALMALISVSEEVERDSTSGQESNGPGLIGG